MYKGYVVRDHSTEQMCQDYLVIPFSNDVKVVEKEKTVLSENAYKVNIEITGECFALISYSLYDGDYKRYKIYVHLMNGGLQSNRYITITTDDGVIRRESKVKLTKRDLKVIEAIEYIKAGKTLDFEYVNKLVRAIPTIYAQNEYINRCRERIADQKYHEAHKEEWEENIKESHRMLREMMEAKKAEEAAEAKPEEPAETTKVEQ